MRLIRGISNWQDTRPSVITIGNFDGAHLGHQAMFASTRRIANERNALATAISFEPLPHEYFTADTAAPRLQGLRDRMSSLSDAGMDRLLLLRFDSALAAMSAEDFIQQILIDSVKACHMIVGDDFRFGHQRLGTYELLMQMSETHGFTVTQADTCLHGQERISSTRIREHLQAGNLSDVQALLGRPYRISGRVIHGEKVGRQLGFPTANVALGDHRPPHRGVFAVWATHVQSGDRYAAVANLGERPTVGGRKLLLEVHALDQNVDWYGDHLQVDFVHQLRSEKRFDSLDELKAQIELDANQARAMMAQN